jgi:hypothetical protein
MEQRRSISVLQRASLSGRLRLGVATGRDEAGVGCGFGLGVCLREPRSQLVELRADDVGRSAPREEL